MTEEASDAPTELLPVEVRPPRLSVLHLMLWTLCSALYLALMRAIYALQTEMTGGYAMLQQASGVIQCIIMGAVFTGAIMLVSIRVRSGPPLLRQPGHWLLFVSAILTLIYFPFIVVLLLILGDQEFNGNWQFLLIGLIYFFPVIAFAIAARRMEDRRWKTLFVALTIVSTSQALLYAGIGFSWGGLGVWFGLLNAMSTWGNLLMAAAIVGVAIVDLRTGPRRDWLHWAGVVTHVAESSVIMLWMVASWFITG